MEFNYKAYKLIFVLENNLREFVLKELKKDNNNPFEILPEEIRNYIQKQKEQKIQYLTTDLMNDNPLNFTLLTHLSQIIIKYWDGIFLRTFKNVDKNAEKAREKVRYKLFELEIMRNYLMHSNLVDDKFVTNIEAIYNFFKSYINDFDENIYSKIEKLKNKKYNFIFNEILNLINDYRNIDYDLLILMKEIDTTLYNDLLEYNKFEKVQINKLKVNHFIKSKNVINRLKDKINEYL